MSETGAGEGGEGREDPQFTCNICLDKPSKPVVTRCGHMYCWGCILHWIEDHPTCPSCPVCKARAPKDTLIPVYGQGEEADGELPPRPTQESEPVEESHPQGRNANWGDIRELFAGDMGGRGGQISFGFGFPFMGFQYMAFHQGANRTPQQAAADAQMAKMVFTIGSIALFFLIFF